MKCENGKCFMEIYEVLQSRLFTEEQKDNFEDGGLPYTDEAPSNEEPLVIQWCINRELYFVQGLPRWDEHIETYDDEVAFEKYDDAIEYVCLQLINEDEKNERY